MAELKKIKERIREMAERPKNVRLSEIEWVVKNLGLNGFQARIAGNVHQTIFTVNGRKFGVCTHHSGSSQLRPEYVKQFVNAMIDWGFAMKTNNKNLKYYLSLPYTTILRKDEDGYVIARIEELQGCISHGKDENEALRNLADMKKLWLGDALAAGEAVPEPQGDDPLPSGKWVQRVPRSLHQKLAKLAQQEGVSLNQLVTQMIAEQFGARTARSSNTKGLGADGVDKVSRSYSLSRRG